MICILTTPTRAYEAYNHSNFIVIKEQLFSDKNQTSYLSLPENTSITENVFVAVDDVCAIAVAQAENEYQIKKDLLQTIASVESGRWSKLRDKRVAWPWTVQSNGSGHYYKTKEEAVQAVKDLQAKGITNIDVGCLQINLKYHGQAFSSVEDALDPEKNAVYGAKFLKNMYEKNGHNWQRTAMQYHSKNHHKGLIYKKRLEKHFAEYIKPNTPQTLF